MKEVNLKTFLNCINYISSLDIDDETRIKRINEVEVKLGEIGENEFANIGNSINLFRDYDILICNLKYYKFKYGIYDDSYFEYDKKFADNWYEHPRRKFTSLETYINTAVATYKHDKELSIFYISLICEEFTEENFIEQINSNCGFNYIRLCHIDDFFHVIQDYLSTTSSKLIINRYITILFAMIFSSFSKIDKLFTPEFYGYGESHYPLFDKLISLMDKDDYRLPFISGYKEEIKERFYFEGNYDRDKGFEFSLRKLTKKISDEHKPTVDFFIRLYANVLTERFADFIVPWNASPSHKHQANWKRAYLYDYFLELKDKTKLLNFLITKHPNKNHNNEPAIKFVLQNYDELLQEELASGMTYEQAAKQADSLPNNIISLYEGSQTYLQKAGLKFFLSRPEKSLHDFHIIFYLTYVLEGHQTFNGYYNSLDNSKKEMLVGLKEHLENMKVSKPKIVEKKHKSTTSQKKTNNVTLQIGQSVSKNRNLTSIYFDELTSLQRSILINAFKLLKTREYVHVQELLNESHLSLKEDFLLSNLTKFSSMHLITFEDEKILGIENEIIKLISKYVEPSLETKIVNHSNNALYKPIFFHDSEMRLYRVLCEVFPQTMVFPNTSLQTIISYDKIREHVDNNTFNYYLKTHVDFILVNTLNYLPLIAFEKDSEYHDTPKAIKKDKMKDEIFSKSGIPLVRLRFNKAIEYDHLKKEILTKTKNILLEHDNRDDVYSNSLIEVISHPKFDLL